MYFQIKKNESIYPFMHYKNPQEGKIVSSAIIEG